MTTLLWPPGLIPVKNDYNDDVCAVRPSSHQFVDQVEHGYVLEHSSPEK
jgi:hypothetical protein